MKQNYVNNNIMVISCSTCQKEEKERTWVKYLIYAVLLQFQFFLSCNLRVFSPPNLYSQNSEFTKKSFFLVWSKQISTNHKSKQSVILYLPSLSDDLVICRSGWTTSLTGTLPSTVEWRASGSTPDTCGHQIYFSTTGAAKICTIYNMPRD